MNLADRRLHRYMAPHIAILVMALCCMMINAAATGAYAFLIGPIVKFLFLGGLDSDDTLARILEWFGISLDAGGHSVWLVWLPLFIFVAAALKGISQFGKFYLMGLFGERAVFQLRGDLYHKLLFLSSSRVEKQGSGDIITRLGSDVTLIQEAVTNVIGSLLSDSLKVAVLLGLAIYLDWQLAVFTALFLPVILLPIVWVGRWLKSTTMNRQDAQAGLSSQAIEDLASLSVIQGYDLSSIRRDKFQNLNMTYFVMAMRSFAARAIASPIMEWMGALGLAGTLWIAGNRMTNGTLVPEHFISFFAAVLMLYEPLKNLGRLNTILQAGHAGAERALAILNWEDERVRDKGTKLLKGSVSEIKCDNVCFSRDEKEILSDVSFSVRNGEMLALVGPSGAGKSTLFSLIMRQLDPASGEILINDENAQLYSMTSLRKSVAMVEQLPVIFDDTTVNNVSLAKKNATDEEIRKVMEDAQLSGLLSRFHNSANVGLGEKGARLSEGEKQRIALARVFLRAPSVVLLDEVTSALDAENEAAILSVISRLREGRIVILIAHRLSSARMADRILVMSEGRIVAQGKHDDLVKNDGIYKRFWKLQQTSESYDNDATSDRVLKYAK